ncbi:hypothetical protein [Rhizobium tropici]|uniref:SAM-dependent methyltransferase n=1 Tax=Rhizobium tropici TaxID=398 RepID=A0ABR6R5V5_RHITR|nr:methyl transferase [Rhizobium tropici CIAT 899]MBB4244181.1 hypothetical protein [Rhizobium tropici]MBB5595284.1 hypothetical protein [Rhizobium tropici]MBB6494446.1 hypothetical protein [Rhizobium tropici]
MTQNIYDNPGFFEGYSRHVEEWSPSDEDLAAHPEWAIERERPMFLLISTRT